MDDLNVIVYTMKGCPYCTELKDLLTESNIKFFDRDIDVYDEEYKMFTEITKNEFIPALLVIEIYGDDYKSYLYAPERDYQELTEAVSIVNNHRKKLIN